jgi:hypothetical protein|tara:strand:- start:1245 stop:1445 length:201 start_codon:yes stop_codon:yes gene_type:complete
VKKGRHRRYEEARALKQNQDLDLDSIFDSLRVDDQEDTTESPADDGLQADADEDRAESLEESTDTA